MTAIEIIPLAGLPEVRPGDPLGRLIADALQREKIALREGDVLAVAQKIVSKAEGRFVRLSDVEPSPEAVRIAGRDGRDARLVEVVLRESNEIVIATERALIVEHRSGAVCAHAGVDRSNLAEGA
ncbi:MAG: coenzyme F420-0:L-glutamate ligase, partial [bacterium]|nr:coenzyme F420-0:L-glutamate ligase [bacterium]